MKNKLPDNLKGVYGENLTMGYDNLVKPLQIMYDEINDYDFKTYMNSGKVIGHFEQMVWKDAKKIGCAVAMCDEVTSYASDKDTTGTKFPSVPNWTCFYDKPRTRNAVAMVPPPLCPSN